MLCPKCGGAFDYAFIPGASVTAIRLGTSRYMRCPICQKFAMFKMTGPEPPEVPSAIPPAEGTPPPP
jgi:hypothetical protein